MSVAKPYQRYHAHAFHPDNGPEPIQGEIFFTTRALSFRGAEKVIEIPIDRLEAEYDGAGEGRVILRDGAQPDLTLTSDASVLEVRSVPVIAALAQQLEAQLTRREFARRGKMVLIFFIGFALVLWVGMLLLGAMVRSIVARVPPEVEKELGN
ncbi:MAG: hypothetical protein L0Y58_02990, partial [Verrucomicrobia subdivision 3 bacterium]|nr:hypothetical protein [Limisphaerales bacterium]